MTSPWPLSAACIAGIHHSKQISSRAGDLPARTWSNHNGESPGAFSLVSPRFSCPRNTRQQVAAAEMKRSALGALLALLFCALSCASAFAHASLLKSTPGDGDLLKNAPQTIELLFNEPVEITAATLVDPKGVIGALKTPPGTGPRVVIPLPAALAVGSHLLSWRVTSEDGHSVSGSLVFSIGRTSGGGEQAWEDSTISVSALSGPLVMTHVLLIAGLVFGVGAALFAAFAGPPAQGRGLALTALGVATFAALLAIGLQGADAHGQGLLALTDRAIWRSGLRLPQGFASMLLLLAIGCSALGLFTRDRAARVLTFSSLVLVALGVSWTSHARTWRPEVLMQALITLHVAAVILWAGSLLPLLRASLRKDFTQRLQFFSRLAAPVYGLLLLSGAALAATQFAAPREVFATAWGVALGVKLGLVVAISCLALVNRYRFTTPALAGDGAAIMNLRRSIRLECAAAVLILATVAFWRLTPPPVSLGARNERALQVHLHGLDAMASMTIKPARVGPVQIRIEPKANDLSPLPVKEMDIYLTPESPDAAPIHRTARLIPGLNVWDVEGMTIPAPGTWILRLELLIDDFERTRLDAVLTIKP